MRVALFPVRGMFCPECISRLRAALQKVPGVQRIVIDLGGRSVSPVLVALEPGGSRQSVTEAVKAAGFSIATGNIE